MCIATRIAKSPACTEQLPPSGWTSGWMLQIDAASAALSAKLKNLSRPTTPSGFAPPFGQVRPAGGGAEPVLITTHWVQVLGAGNGGVVLCLGPVVRSPSQYGITVTPAWFFGPRATMKTGLRPMAGAGNCFSVRCAAGVLAGQAFWTD